MKNTGRRLAKGIRRSMPLALYPILIRRDVIGLFYHSVSDQPLPHIQHLYPPEPVARFEAALRYIKRHYHVVTDAQVEAHRLHRKPLPGRALHLSFDDGFAECFTVVRPLLLKHKIPCTFFVTAGWVDNGRMFYRNKASLCIEQMLSLEHDAAKMVLTSLNNALDLSLADPAGFVRWIKTLEAKDEGIIDMTAKMLGIDMKDYLRGRQPYMTSAQIKQLHADGFTIGAHAMRHAKLASLPAAEVESEIIDSARFVQKLTGQPRVPFSFPYSATGSDRGLLAEIRSRHPFLGLFYDTMDLHQDVDFMVNRIWAEKSAYRKAGRETNVPALLHAAYRAEAYAAMRSWCGGARGDEEEIREEQ
jgi:peptidoglycan/xylan/chitin deacetylase (PgdA/CDA1 family)